MRLNSRCRSVIGVRIAVSSSRVVVDGASARLRRPSQQQYTFEEVASGLKHKDPATRLRAIQILKDADYAGSRRADCASCSATRTIACRLAAIDAERSLFTMRPVSRAETGRACHRDSGHVCRRRVAAEGQLALKARVVPRRCCPAWSWRCATTIRACGQRRSA